MNEDQLMPEINEVVSEKNINLKYDRSPISDSKKQTNLEELIRNITKKYEEELKLKLRLGNY